MRNFLANCTSSQVESPRPVWVCIFGFTVAILAGSGTNKLTSKAWLQALNPRVVLISVDAGNPNGNPSPDVLARLSGRAVLRTDQRGNITLSTDGEQLWVEAER